MIAALPANEDLRLEFLEQLQILDTPQECAFDDLARLAALICETPIALVSLVDERRQWFKACLGLDVRETHRDLAFCAHAILQDDLLIVPDATQDERFCDNPLVTGAPGIRFYAGVPLSLKEGVNVGTLCVIDCVPRTLTERQQEALRMLARRVAGQILQGKQVAMVEQAVLEKSAAHMALEECESRFRTFMDHSPALAFMKNEQGQYVYVNREACSRFGRPEKDWLGRNDLELWPADIARALREVDQKVLAENCVVSVDELAVAPDGEMLQFQVFKFPFVDAAGQRFLAGMAVDRTAERKAEAALRRSEAKFRDTVDRLAEGVFIIDASNGRFVDANAAVLKTLGYTREEFLALQLFDIVAGETSEIFERTVQEVKARLSAHGQCDVGRRLFRTKLGHCFPVDVRISVVTGENACLHACIVRDITKQVAYEDQLHDYQSSLEEANLELRALATTDALTGIRNRAAFDERLAEEVERLRRHGRPLSLILLDVDHFKLFNDRFGHTAGDEVLRSVGGILRDVGRAMDVVARYGGEEFALILPDTDHSGAMVIAERCRRGIASADWPCRPITVSVGVTTSDSGPVGHQEFLDEADQALYYSKRHGRNRVTHSEILHASRLTAAP